MDSPYREKLEVNLERAGGGELMVNTRYGPRCSIADLDELTSFIVVCQNRFERRQTQKIKLEKLHALAIQNTTAQLRQMAKEEKFNFLIESDSAKIKVFIYVSEKHALQLHIPYKNHQEFVPKIRESVKAVRLLNNQGIKFRVDEVKYWSDGDKIRRGREWIQHETL
ncbi:MAG: hypothetical protein AAF639_28050 [Chloroflexota bacterium]